MLKVFSLKDKVAFVTGGSGYLGECMVQALAEAGAKVYVNGRNEEKIFSLVGKLKKNGLDVEPAVFDITNEQKMRHFFDVLESNSLDILVNNAHSGGGSGGKNGGPIETSLAEDYVTSYNVSVVSSHNLVQCVLPLLRKAKKINGGASVINIASMYGIVSPDLRMYESRESSNPPFYGAAKAALIQWTRYASCEFAEEGIRFNSISPGAFPNHEAQNNINLIEKIKRKVPMNRIGKPEDLIGALIFLASDSSSYVTGTNVVVDGGWTAQ
jgi:NAD(P)-dependent dehydrogenase (short-subunit alcohol dehydrogenase family)